MSEYNLTNMKIIVGDLENAQAIDTIIFITKKVIYTAKEKEQKPHILNVENDIKNFFI